MGRNRRGGGDWLAVKVALGVCGGLAAFAALSGWCCLSWQSYQRAERRRADDEYERKMWEEDRREREAQQAAQDKADRANAKEYWRWAVEAEASGRAELERAKKDTVSPETVVKSKIEMAERHIDEAQRRQRELEKEARERWQKHPRDL